MNIKWAYYFIAILYVILIVLRVINYLNRKAYIKDNTNIEKAFSIKKDFFTTVAVICIIVTLGINIAALIGGKAFNTSSICVTLLVIGITLLNSFSYILFSEENHTIHFVGYTLRKGDIQEVKVKTGKVSTSLNITFNKEIESYNYVKLLVYGSHRAKLVNILEALKGEKSA